MPAQNPSDYNSDGSNFGTYDRNNYPRQSGGILYSDPGAAGKTNQGFRNRNSFGGIEGGADQNVNRYRGMGYDAAGRDAYHADYTNSNQSRDIQMGSLALLDARARGTAPSAAEISGRAAVDASLQGQVAAAGSARGGAMQQATAMRTAAERGAGQQANMAAGIQAGRANEMAVASGQLVQGAEGVRGQDLSQTGQQIQNEQFQRSLNQGGQQFYEGLGFNVNAAQLAASQQAQAELTNEWQAERGQTVQDEANVWNRGVQVAGTVASAVGGAAATAAPAASDERVKTNITPINLSGIFARAGGGEEGPAMSPAMGTGHNPYPETGAQAAAGKMVGSPTLSDERTKDGIESLHSYLDQERAGAGDPYERPKEMGAGGAPRGYAAGREGQAGYMFGGAPPVTHGYEPRSAAEYGGLAPGSDDFDRYGASAKFQGDPDWTRGGATTKAPAADAAPKTAGALDTRSVQAGDQGGNWISNMLLGMNRGVQSSPMVRSTQSRDVTTSDPRAKVDAYELGHAHGSAGLPPASGAMGAGPTPPPIRPQQPQPMGNMSTPNYGGMTSMVPRGAMNAPPMGMPPPQQPAQPQTTPYGGMAGATRPANAAAPASMGARPTMLSDDRTKLVAAFRDGQNYGAIQGDSAARGVPAPKMSLPEYMPNEAATSAPRALDVGKGPAPSAPKKDPAHSGGVGPTEPEHQRRQKHAEADPMRDANRSMAASAYEYRPEYTPQGQQPGEVNVGPMAQNMASNPVASTAIVQQPDGMLAIDKEKGMKLLMGSVASLQNQVDGLEDKKRRRVA